MAMDEPDELSVMASISYNRHNETEKLEAHGEDEMLPTPDPTKCTISGPGLKTGEVHVQQTFTTKAKNAKNNNIEWGGHQWDVKVTDPEEKPVEVEGSRTTTTSHTTRLSRASTRSRLPTRRSHSSSLWRTS